jgi:hypothetical protein
LPTASNWLSKKSEPELNVFRSPRFEHDAQELLAPDRREAIVRTLEGLLRHRAEFGARVKGTDVQVWPIYPNDGYAYIAYYRISGGKVMLQSLIRRRTPVAPQFFELEED